MATPVEYLPGFFPPQLTHESAPPQEKPLRFPPLLERHRMQRGNEFTVSGAIYEASFDKNWVEQRFREHGIPLIEGVGFSVYNPSAKTKEGYIAVRIEQSYPHSEHSVVGWFREEKGTLVLDEEKPVAKLQDPFITYINGELIFGGVRINEDDYGRVYCKDTIFYRDFGLGIDHLKPFALGPTGMKDVRLVELKDGRVGVFTRPQGGEAGKGQIGFTIVNSLSHLTTKAMEKAPLIGQRFPEKQWGAVNWAHKRSDGKIAAGGHEAYMDEEGNRHYCAITFILDPVTRISTPFKVALTTEEILGINAVEAKKPDLDDVLFLASFEWDADTLLEKAELLTVRTGIKDSAIATRQISNPFL